MDVNIQLCIIQNSSCSWWLIRGEFNVYVSRRCAPTVSQSVSSMEKMNGTKTNMYFMISCGFWHDFWHSLLLLLPPAKKKKKKKMACKFMESLSTSVILPNEPHSCTSGEMILQQCWLLDTLQVIMWSICCCLGSDAWTPNKQQVSVYGHRSPMVYDRFGVLSTAEGDKIKTCFLGRV